jgi:hypothetical protein
MVAARYIVIVIVTIQQVLWIPLWLILMMCNLMLVLPIWSRLVIIEVRRSQPGPVVTI